MLEKYKNLVFRLAHKWARIMEDDVDFEDLVQEGWIALCKAQRKFDSNKGTKFITYAFTAINNRYIDMYKDFCKRRAMLVNRDLEEKSEENDLLALLSEEAKTIAKYILSDNTVEECEDMFDVVSYWRGLEKKFGFSMQAVKAELERALL